MATRTTQSIVSFSSPFMLPGFGEPQPAGDYRVDYDEESIEGISRMAWRHVATFIHLPSITVQGGAQQMLPVARADLREALEKDHYQSWTRQASI